MIVSQMPYVPEGATGVRKNMLLIVFALSSRAVSTGLNCHHIMTDQYYYLPLQKVSARN
jgi:hypothetical protein